MLILRTKWLFRCYYYSAETSKENKKLERLYIEKELLLIQKELVRYAYSLTWDRVLADDLMQETALKILRNWDKFKKDTNFRNWARRIMLNTYINELRQHGRFVSAEEFHINNATGTPLHTNENYCDIEGIYNAINCLPAEGREPMRLLILGHKYQEIAMILNLPLGTVKSRINNSRSTLKRTLKDFLY